MTIQSTLFIYSIEVGKILNKYVTDACFGIRETTDKRKRKINYKET